MPVQNIRAQTLAALSRVPRGQANQESVKHFVDALHGNEVILQQDQTTTSTVLVDIPGLTVRLREERSYEIEVLLYVFSTTTAGCRYGLQFTTPDFGSIDVFLLGRTGVKTAAMEWLTRPFNSPSVNAYNTTASSGAIWMRGIISTATEYGDLSVRQLKVSSGTATAFAGSGLRAREVTFYGG